MIVLLKDVFRRLEVQPTGDVICLSNDAVLGFWRSCELVNDLTPNHWSLRLNLSFKSSWSFRWWHLGHRLSSEEECDAEKICLELSWFIRLHFVFEWRDSVTTSWVSWWEPEIFWFASVWILFGLFFWPIVSIPLDVFHEVWQYPFEHDIFSMISFEDAAADKSRMNSW